MSRSLFVTSIALAVLSSSITGSESRGQETAAQVEAKSQAARQQAARDRVNQKTLITKPSAGGAATRDRDEAATDPQPESLKRRAGEQVGDDARGRSQILGMYVQEGEGGRVRVVEVGAATPAFAAGIKRGDELISFSNFNANSYRKWIDGIRRLATEAKSGDMIPVVVLRNGEEVATEIRAPESHTGPIQLPIGPQVVQQPMSTGQQSDVVGVPVGGVNVAIDNVGPFADFFNQNGTPAAERAMAELFRVGSPANDQNLNGSKVNPNVALPAGGGDQSPAALAGSSNSGNARIGLAGFRNDPNGMLVMVDVGGLQPGNYVVGIGDPGIAGQIPNAGGNVPSNVRAPAANQPGSAGDGGGSPTSATPGSAAPAARGTEQPENSQRGTTRPAAPQSSVRPDERLIPRTVLAQVAANDVLSPAPAQPNAQPRTSVPATGQANPSTIPATGKVNPSSALPNGQSAANNALTEQMKPARGGQPGPGSAAITQPVGTLTVDQSGTGRLQQVVEGVQVQNVIGQALVIVAQPAISDSTLPPNLDATVEGKVADQPQNATNQRLPNQAASAANSGVSNTSSGPVAAGIIRLLSDRGPSVNQAPAGSERSATNQPPGTDPTGQPGAIR